jgi:ESX secretion-associated protein EspC/F
MSDLVVAPDYLNQLATIDGQTSDKIGSAAAVATGIKDDVWVTHGMISGESNEALADAEAARRSLVEAMQTYAHDLATKVKAAVDAYVSTDEQAAENIDTQVVTR